MPEFLTELLRGLFLALTHFPAIDNHIASVGYTVDKNRTEMKLAEVHLRQLSPLDFGLQRHLAEVVNFQAALIR